MDVLASKPAAASVAMLHPFPAAATMFDDAARRLELEQDTTADYDAMAQAAINSAASGVQMLKPFFESPDAGTNPLGRVAFDAAAHAIAGTVELMDIGDVRNISESFAKAGRDFRAAAATLRAPIGS